MIPDRPITMYVTSGNKKNEEEICGLEEKKPCGTLSDVFSQLSDSATDTIILLETELNLGFSDASECSFNLIGKGNDKSIIFVSKEPDESHQLSIIGMYNFDEEKVFKVYIEKIGFYGYNDKFGEFISIGYMYELTLTDVSFTIKFREKADTYNQYFDTFFTYALVEVERKGILRMKNCIFYCEPIQKTSSYYSSTLLSCNDNSVVRSNRSNKYGNENPNDYNTVCYGRYPDVYVNGSEIDVDNCSFSGFTDGAFFINSSNMTVTNSKFYNNS